MKKFTVTSRISFVALVLWPVSALLILSGCKDEDQPEDAQQATEPQKTEHIYASERIKQAGTPKKLDLRILYVGLPDTERQKDFVEFLRQHFRQVETANYNTFEEEQTKDCDVAIFDKDGVEWKPLDIEVSGQYSRATISIGVPGAFWCDRVSSKMGYI